MVAEGLEMVEFQAGQTIFAQGEPGDKFFVIREGTGALQTYKGCSWEGCAGRGTAGSARLGEPPGAGLRAALQEHGAAGGRRRRRHDPLALLACGRRPPYLPPPAAPAAVVLTKDGNELARLGEEAYFGERALINAEPRAAAATGAPPGWERWGVACGRGNACLAWLLLANAEWAL